MNQPVIKAREPFDWKSVEPQFQRLLEEDLRPERVPAWLLEWSNLEDVIGEAQAVAGAKFAFDRKTVRELVLFV